MYRSECTSVAVVQPRQAPDRRHDPPQRVPRATGRRDGRAARRRAGWLARLARLQRIRRRAARPRGIYRSLRSLVRLNAEC